MLQIQGQTSETNTKPNTVSNSTRNLDETKLVVITHKELSAGYQVVQSTHSIADFIFEHPEQAKQWKEESNSIITLACPNLESLEKLSNKLKKKGYFVTEFFEPDIDNELTSICVFGTPEVRKKLSYLPLTLKEKKPVLEET